ncbi:MAG TPA: plastocyanin/azurin family copper-binding protein [Solirubrobacteraceae bacterium]|nr:plastocyanin/azurin family copper-binding protein [Solirubrobacteraceae bacterium]
MGPRGAGTRRIFVVAASIGLALGVNARADYGGGTSAPPGPPAADVTANGNAVYDQAHLSFKPENVAVAVGQAVRWTNTDPVVPHTVTEDHGLFDLAGTYGMTPANPAGFAPGTSVQRDFEAGTFSYHCRVHGAAAMHGTVAVPVTLTLGSAPAAYRAAVAFKKVKRHRRGGQKRGPKGKPNPAPTPPGMTPGRLIHAVWASAPPASGLAFDVQFRQNGGDWQVLRADSSQIAADLPGAPAGTLVEVRARVKKAGDANAASDWSPQASVTA